MLQDEKAGTAPPKAHCKRVLESRTSCVANVFEATSKKDKSRYLRAYFPNLKTRDEALIGGNVVAGTREHSIDIMRVEKGKKDGGDSDSEIEIEFENLEELLLVVTDL